MEEEYLVSYGSLGDLGRFRAVRPVDGRRGDLAVVRSPRGVEVGQVLCPATPRHARLLSGTAGDLLRLATEEDEQALKRQRDRGQEVFDEARRRAIELGLPLEVLDAELLLDSEHVVLHFVRWDDGDLRELVSSLSRRFDVHVLLQDLTRPEPSPAEGHGCGSGGCGSGGCGSGGCGSGGCSTGCGVAKADEVRAYFAELREQMLRRNRTPLL